MLQIRARFSKLLLPVNSKMGYASKTDTSATFMQVKSDYMGNVQLLPAYNLQTAVCDEYIAVVDIKQYATDTECFVPLMENFNKTYGHYPKYPVADAGLSNGIDHTKYSLEEVKKQWF